MSELYPQQIDTITSLYEDTNQARTQLATEINVADGNGVTFDVTDGSNFPTNNFVVLVGSELTLISLRVGNTFTIDVRGFENTVAQTWPIGTELGNVYSAEQRDIIKRSLINQQQYLFNQKGVIQSRLINDPSTITPVYLEQYIVGPAPIGDWLGQTDNLTYWDGAAWQFIAPVNGDRVYSVGDSAIIKHEGGQWINDESIPAYSSTIAWESGDIFYESGELYQVIASIPAGVVFDPADPNLLQITGSRANTLSDWAISTYYKTDNIVIDSASGLMYRSLSEHTSPATGDLLDDNANWEQVSAKFQGDWNIQKSFRVGDMVQFGGQLYRATVAIPDNEANPSVNPNWNIISGAEFTDANFVIRNDADNTKEQKFNVSSVTTGTTRTIESADRDVDMGKLSDDYTTGANYDLGDLCIESSGIYQANIQILNAPAVLNPTDWTLISSPGIVTAPGRQAILVTNDTTVAVITQESSPILVCNNTTPITITIPDLVTNPLGNHMTVVQIGTDTVTLAGENTQVVIDGQQGTNPVLLDEDREIYDWYNVVDNGNNYVSSESSSVEFLADLQDIDDNVVTLATGMVPVYNQGINTYEIDRLSIGQLGDVTFTTPPNTGDVLTFDGVEWDALPNAGAGGSLTPYTVAATYSVGDLITFNNAIWQCKNPIASAPNDFSFNTDWRLQDGNSTDLINLTVGFTLPVVEDDRVIFIGPISDEGMLTIDVWVETLAGDHQMLTANCVFHGDFDTAEITLVNSMWSDIEIFKTLEIAGDANNVWIIGKVTGTHTLETFNARIYGLTTPTPESNFQLRNPPILAGLETVLDEVNLTQGVITSNGGVLEYLQLGDIVNITTGNWYSVFTADAPINNGFIELHFFTLGTGEQSNTLSMSGGFNNARVKSFNAAGGFFDAIRVTRDGVSNFYIEIRASATVSVNDVSFKGVMNLRTGTGNFNRLTAPIAGTTLSTEYSLSDGSVLNDLGDVTIAAPLTGDVLQYDGVEWLNSQVSGLSGAPAITDFFPNNLAVTVGDRLRVARLGVRGTFSFGAAMGASGTAAQIFLNGTFSTNGTANTQDLVMISDTLASDTFSLAQIVGDGSQMWLELVVAANTTITLFSSALHFSTQSNLGDAAYPELVQEIATTGVVVLTENVAITAIALADLSDVDDQVSILQDGMTLRYNLNDVRYDVTYPLLNDNSDVNVLGAVDDDVLTFSGAGWVPSPINYSNMKIERILDGLSVAASQQPAGTGDGNAIQIEFGPAINGPSDPVELSATGTLTFNEAGLYRLKVTLLYGRSGNAGTAELRFRAVVNGVQAGQTLAAQIPNGSVEIPYGDEAWLQIPVSGVTIAYELQRDSSGANAGGIFQALNSGSWNDCTCAAIRVERWI